jgi:glycosyltransferase involved in cell wall biosynthesis
MDLNYSVIICSHNPRQDYLQRALAALQAQTLPREEWELLLIDNASDQKLAEFWDISWHPHARHLREDELGLTPARLRGIREAQGERLIFVDDDNVLAPDFLSRVSTIVTSHPDLHVFGAGLLEPEYEVRPEPETTPFLPMLALRSVPSPRWSNNPCDRSAMPWGAGLCVTREIAAEYVRLIQQLDMDNLLDRRGDQLFSAGDDVFSWASARAGKAFGVFPELRVVHLISAGRLTRNYFLNLIYNWWLSHGVLHYRLMGTMPRGIRAKRIVRMLVTGLPKGWFYLKCEWAAARGEQRARSFIAEKHLQPLDPVE